MSRAWLECSVWARSVWARAPLEQASLGSTGVAGLVLELGLRRSGLVFGGYVAGDPALVQLRRCAVAGRAWSGAGLVLGPGLRLGAWSVGRGRTVVGLWVGAGSG